VAKRNLKIVERHRLLSGYIPKLHSEILIKKTKQDLKKALQRKKPNVYQIAACRKLLKNLLKQKRKDELKDRKEYERIYKEKNETTIKKAMSGNNKSLFRLIEWDINWLFEDWVKRKILIAKGIDNRPFLEGISNAVKSRRNKNKTTHQDLYNELRYLRVMGFNFNNTKKVKELRETMKKILLDSEKRQTLELEKRLEAEKRYTTEINAKIDKLREKFEGDPYHIVITDQDYFTKFLIRHKLKSGH